MFYEVTSREDFAGYWPEEKTGVISDNRIPEWLREKETLLGEYLGDPPISGPRKQGSFHKSANGFFVRDDAIDLFEAATRGNLIKNPTRIIGRESETFWQVWVTNVVDCLDVANTVASPQIRREPGKLGVIERPAFHVERWDGSGVFIVPQDRNGRWFCSEQFIGEWKKSKRKGIKFSRFFFDPAPIKC
jgi:hypothetical protein